MNWTTDGINKLLIDTFGRGLDAYIDPYNFDNIVSTLEQVISRYKPENGKRLRIVLIRRYEYDQPLERVRRRLGKWQDCDHWQEGVDISSNRVQQILSRFRSQLRHYSISGQIKACLTFEDR